MNYDQPNMNINNQEQNTNVDYQSNNTNTYTYKKDNKKIIVIIIIIVSLIASFAGGTYYGKTLNKLSNETKCSNDTPSNIKNDDITNENYTFNNFNPKTIEVKAENNDELTKGIEIKEIFFNPKCKEAYSKYRDAYIYGKNNNSIPLHIKITIEYYDGDGKRVDKDNSDSYVYANSEFVNNMTIKDDSLYKTAKISYRVEKNKSYETTIALDQTEITTQITSSKDITAFIKNKSDKKAYFDVTCLYYKDGKVIFGNHRGYLSIEPGITEENKFYTSQYLRLGPKYDSEMMEFDDYKVFIQGARYSNDDTY